MKISIIIFAIAALYTSFAFGLGAVGESSYKVLPGSLICKENSPSCCSQHSDCSVRYVARGSWVTELDRQATTSACEQECEIHFRKCSDLCACASRQREVRSTKHCKCQVTTPEFGVRGYCLRHCVDGGKICLKNCATKECPLQAITKINWEQEFKGKCSGVCKHDDFLSSVCE